MDEEPEYQYASAATIAQALDVQGAMRDGKESYERDARAKRIEIMRFLAEARAAERGGEQTAESVVKVLRAKEAVGELNDMRRDKFGY